jgi:hypothetical protein
MSNPTDGATTENNSREQLPFTEAPPNIVIPPKNPAPGVAKDQWVAGPVVVSQGPKVDGGGIGITPSGHIVPFPPWEPRGIRLKLTEKERVAARDRSLAMGVTALASWLGKEASAIQKEAAKVLVESAGELGAARRKAGATKSTQDPIPASWPRISALAEAIRAGILGIGASTPDPIPGIVSEIYREMERLTSEMFAREGEVALPQSDTALQKLALSVAIQNLASYMSEKGQALETAAANLVEHCSREVAETIQ